MEPLQKYLKIYLKNRPLFLGLLRAKELELYQRFLFATTDGLKDKTILDFGCGDGFFMKALKEENKDYFRKVKLFGLDIDQQKLIQAERLKIYNRVLVYDGRKFPFPDKFFEAVISNCVLEHIWDLPQVLAEIYRVLKPKGKFYTTAMTKNWEEYLLGKIFLGRLYQKWMGKIQKHYSLLSAGEWQIAFKKAGFKTVDTVGYLDQKASRWIDILHYVSVGSLLSYKLTGRWVFFPWQYDLLPVDNWLSSLVEKDINTDKSSAIFFVLEKA